MHAGRPKLKEFLGEQAVLMIEPSGNYRSSLKQFLANLKVRHVKVASSAEEARREMLTINVGLFVVEWELRDTNGLQLCRELRKTPRYRDTPFLLLSTENLRSDVILASEVKIDGYLLKPFSYEDFSTQIEQIVRARNRPSKLNTLLDFAEEALAQGDLAAADQLFTESLTMNDKSARAFVGMARIKRQRGDIPAAEQMLEQATWANPEYIDSYKEILEIATIKRDKVAMIHAATRLHRLSPDNPRYALVLASTHLQMSNLDASEALFKKAVLLSPRLAEAYKGLGTVYLAKEDFERAAKNFKKSLDLDAGDVSVLNCLGLTYVRMGLFKEGITKYLAALKLEPTDARLVFNIGHAHEKQQEPEKARWYYQQALTLSASFEKAKRGLERLEKKGAGGANAWSPMGETDDDEIVIPWLDDVG